MTKKYKFEAKVEFAPNNFWEWVGRDKASYVKGKGSKYDNFSAFRLLFSFFCRISLLKF